MSADVNASATVLNGRSFTLREAASPAAPHVRSYFPEALYINPEIITDAKGNADISIPVADSITTWRMAMLASTQSGALGTGSSSLKVFQDFFVDLDLPITLTPWRPCHHSHRHLQLLRQARRRLAQTHAR